MTTLSEEQIECANAVFSYNLRTGLRILVYYLDDLKETVLLKRIEINRFNCAWIGITDIYDDVKLKKLHFKNASKELKMYIDAMKGIYGRSI